MLSRDQVQDALDTAHAVGLLDQGGAAEVIATFDAASPFRAARLTNRMPPSHANANVDSATFPEC